jgi:hypothetical protein
MMGVEVVYFRGALNRFASCQEEVSYATLFNALHLKFDNFNFHLYLILFFALSWCKYGFVGGEEMKLCGRGSAPRSSFNTPRHLIRLNCSGFCEDLEG